MASLKAAINKFVIAWIPMRLSNTVYWCVISAAFSLAIGPVFACAPDRIDAKVNIVWVYDGDTVRLKGREKLRLIGIDAPELGRDGKPAQPYSKAARQALQDILASQNNRVLLRYGTEQRDAYGRLLVHLYLPDKTSVNAQLLRRGLAIALTVPPNDWNLECYRGAEAQARREAAGIWSLPQYRKIKSSRLKGAERGFRIVEGTITAVGRSRHALWFNFEDKLAIRIDHDDVQNFSLPNFSKFKGKRAIVRGWLYKHKGKLYTQLRHPVDLKILP